MQDVFEAVHRVAPSKATVLLRGESGTGKTSTVKSMLERGGQVKRSLMTGVMSIISQTLTGRMH